MAKLILGKTPVNFKSFNVEFTLPDGEEDKIFVTYKYMTRTQFAAFLNKLFSSVGEEAPAADEKVDFVKLFAKGGEKTVDHLTEIIAAWDFAEKPTAETMRQLHDQAPAAAAALTTRFSQACTDGKLGN